ncbi:DUF896 domain-containing protein [Schleiferilactobacillus harbinensis]|jgi:uncharacterized protein YnzC (UPF0291/DUF896 family)|uniref:UPF0291 protein D1010_10375 n=2 Tax=Schleiferilactobacillus harbinensis TaxID=304207 RepID=A0A510TRJ1_9LACO|nr:DUF896 domain-containing protein [Schleiferilactobacillus harbinensis]KRM24921.1 hypothetical protein FC91_GL001292 [Schleiferilactobacillus harbinensis DSM 16991]MBO3091010.1 DUF896 domain-containing protein [Schleiferilactobacillus harbinensis]MCI1687773.1 DUF896 domain-containing protein [Schleiferilactobacillus harbinensis]MCI1782280.1 DUF896 domain-containing protein [Schleiferilactobacillus harbinensis]MCI1850147.1 DUF896 domain-containing protein [Schleiferilactobacillus harbinensis]
MAEQTEEEKRLARINELAHKAKKEGLTADEEREQHELREAYLANFRAGFRQTIEHLKVIDEEGNEVTPDKLKRVQREKGIRKD